MTFTHEMREELAHLPVPPACCARAELRAALRFGGAFRRSGGDRAGFGLALETTSGAVARRLHAALRREVIGPPEIHVLEAGGLQDARRYRLVLAADAAPALRTLGVLDDAGRPSQEVPGPLARPGCDRTAYLRGALLVAGSVAAPDKEAHLEILTPSWELAEGLAALLRAAGADGARASAHRGSSRVVVKSGRQVADLLASAGAHTAFLTYDQGRLRRELRGAANRAANADRANVARAVAASSRQARGIEQVIEQVGWDALDDELRAVALARIANPEATLAELGALLNPPVGKTTVHRRLQRLLALGDGG
jgi:cell division protein WhiA